MKKHELSNKLIVIMDRYDMSRADRDTMADACNWVSNTPEKSEIGTAMDITMANYEKNVIA